MTVNYSYRSSLVEPHTALLVATEMPFEGRGVTALKRSGMELLIHSGKLEESLSAHEAISPLYLAM
jgi:hypothetical protein